MLLVLVWVLGFETCRNGASVVAVEGGTMMGDAGPGSSCGVLGGLE